MSTEQILEPTTEIQIQILEQQKHVWINTHYSASVQWRVGKTIGDEQLQAQMVKQMADALKAQDEIDKMIEELA